MTKNKFEFIDANDTNKTNAISINNIYLSACNPRYTLIDNVNVNLIEFINGSNDKSQDSIYNDLLRAEGDFNELSSLLNNIDKNGFNNINEPIYLIEKKDDLGNYVVAEGNRRIMCLKLINNDFQLPSEPPTKNESKYSNSLTDYSNDDDDEIDLPHKTLENFKQCKNLLNSIKEKHDIKFKIYYIITDDENKLWGQVYDKHLTGTRPGLRQWSRSKYFADLLSICKNGLPKENDTNNIISRFNREYKMIKKDFKEAQYIYSCFFFGASNNCVCDPDFLNLDKGILEDMIHADRVSALEIAHSFNKVRTILCDDIFYCAKNDFANNHLKIEFPSENNYRIKFVYNNDFPYNKLLKWIYKKWADGTITTREFKSKDKPKLIEELKFNVIEDADFSQEMDVEQLDKLNEFELSIDKLEKIIKANKSHKDPNVINRFIYAHDINKSISDFTKEIETNNSLKKYPDNNPLAVFVFLSHQLKHNYKNLKECLNAICVTLRTLLEQTLVWLMFSSLCNGECEDKKREFITKLADPSSRWFWNEGKINNIKITEDKIKYVLRLCLKSGISVDYDGWSKRLVDIDSFKCTLNKHIHSLHRIYISNKYIERLHQITENTKFILNLIKAIDFDNEFFKELNEGIIKIVHEEENKNSSKDNKPK